MTPASTTLPAAGNPARGLGRMLIEHGFGPFLYTPCGVLAPLCSVLAHEAGLWTVPREDTMVGMAAGAALGGASPVVLTQNSGLGQSVNALASLVVPYRIPMLLLVSMRGLAPDSTAENAAMGRLTRPLLAQLGIASWPLPDADGLPGLFEQLERVVLDERRPAAVLVGPDAFGWSA